MEKMSQAGDNNTQEEKQTPIELDIDRRIHDTVESLEEESTFIQLEEMKNQIILPVITVTLKNGVFETFEYPRLPASIIKANIKERIGHILEENPGSSVEKIELNLDSDN